MQEPKLRPCPFCGAPAAVVSGPAKTFVRCRLCGARGKAYKGSADIDDWESWPCSEAIMAWNLRNTNSDNYPRGPQDDYY